MSPEKLSSKAKQLIDATPVRAGRSEEAHVEIDVLIRTTRTVSSEDHSAIESLGAAVRTVAGDVLTACVAVDRLLDLADLEVVAYVEVSRPLMPEELHTDEEPHGGK
jgi:ethanolamine utilization microcompartment shell protein EutL